MTVRPNESIKITCRDGYLLSGSLYRPASKMHAAVMIAPATGIKKTFYHAFATHLAEQGYGVVTFENRGIGESLRGKLKDSKATIRDWGYLDMPAVLDSLKSSFPSTSHHLVGHSAGGQLAGLMHNHGDLRSMFNVACSSGQLDNMRAGYRRKAKIFMNAFAPLNNAVFGYTNTQWIGMGEPLPKGVAQEWCDWCNGAGYIETAFGKSVKEHWYDAINCPSLWINATDDDIANNANVDDMTRVFTKMSAQGKIERLTIDPSEHGYQDLGHMKFFSRKRSGLWDIATNWLERQCDKDA